MPQDHYFVLGVNSGATEKEISKAFKEKMRRWHPDAWPEAKKAEVEQQVKKVTAAYTVLSDRKRRAAYDETRPAMVATVGYSDPACCRKCGAHAHDESELRRFEGEKLCEGCFWTLVMERKKAKGKK